ALAVGLAAAAPRLAWPAVFLAVLTGSARVLAGDHYPHDVLAGAAVGTVLCLAALAVAGSRGPRGADAPARAGPDGGAPIRPGRSPRTRWSRGAAGTRWWPSTWRRWRTATDATGCDPATGCRSSTWRSPTARSPGAWGAAPAPPAAR